jgi:hypothetical protein
MLDAKRSSLMAVGVEMGVLRTELSNVNEKCE